MSANVIAVLLLVLAMALMTFWFVRVSPIAHAASSHSSAAPPSSERLDSQREVVVLAFFGLVKKIDDEQLATLRMAILDPLRMRGFDIMPVLYTHRVATFVSRRSGERHTFNQSDSIATLRKELPNLFVVMEDANITDSYFESMRLPSMLKFGNAFQFFQPDPNETMLYWCRQQYSLMRVTELWSKQFLFDGREVGAPHRTAAEVMFMKQSSKDEKIRGVIYLRPDLYFFSQLNMDAFETITLKGVENMKLRNISAVQRLSRERVKQLHPWVAASNLSLYFDVLGKEVNATMKAVMDVMTLYPMHIAVPMVEFGGVSDRFAFGSPDAMLAYGIRGLAVQFAVDRFREAPHPETTLHKYLCAVHARIHVSTTFFALKRTHGQLAERGAVSQRAQVLGQQVPYWIMWSGSQPLEEYGYGNYTSCLVDSWWMAKPFPNSKRRAHLTPFQW